MSKFKELGEAWEKGAGKDREHRERAFEFIRQLIRGFQSYLEAPDDAFSFRPMTGEYDLDTTYSRFGALTLGEDRKWHFGLIITLKVDEEEAVFKPRGLLHFKFKDNKPQADSYNIKVGSEDKEFDINADSSNATPLFDYLYEMIVGDYENGLDRFLQRGEEERIGF